VVLTTTPGVRPAGMSLTTGSGDYAAGLGNINNVPELYLDSGPPLKRKNYTDLEIRIEDQYSS